MIKDIGVKLHLLIGPTVVRPAPYEVMDALMAVQVDASDERPDTFQMVFALGKDSVDDYGLLRERHFEPPARVSVAVTMASGYAVLINGVITHHQVVPSDRPGETRLYVTGEDLGFELSRHARSVTFPNAGDADIVRRILRRYRDLRPSVTATSDRPAERRRVPSQQGTDLAYVRRLAERNGFVFYLEPTELPGLSTAYWGPQRRRGPKQPALSVGFGPYANVDGEIAFEFDAAGPAEPEVTILEPRSGRAVPIRPPDALLPALSRSPAAPMRTEIARDAANLDPIQAALRALATSDGSADTVTGRGELDVVRYGHVLRPRRLVGVRGAGTAHDGDYYVREVRHHIRPGLYRQSFVLAREGRGATSRRVTTL